MRLSLRVLGLDLIDLEVSTDGQPPPRESDIGIAAIVPTDPPRLGFEDRSR